MTLFRDSGTIGSTVRITIIIKSLYTPLYYSICLGLSWEFLYPSSYFFCSPRLRAISLSGARGTFIIFGYLLLNKDLLCSCGM